MPLFDYFCEDCRNTSEILVSGPENMLVCKNCGSRNLKKLLSAHSSYSGNSRNSYPGPKDTACCGSVPGEADGCAGPGSCCGKNFT